MLYDDPQALYRTRAKDGTLRYVGKSNDPLRRAEEHCRSKDWMAYRADRIDLEWYPTARVSLDQTNLTLAADHARWLRDKRSEVYVEMIRFLQDASRHRHAVIGEREVGEGLKQEVQKVIASYDAQSLHNLLVMGQAYALRDVGDIFSQAASADLEAWKGFLAAMRRAEPGQRRR